MEACGEPAAATGVDAGVLVRDLWDFVQATACASEVDTADARLALLEKLQRQAAELLARRTNGESKITSTVANGDETTVSESVSAAQSGDDEHTPAARTPEEANERVARRMLEREGSITTSNRDDDKSDTLSDCTTITETSSVYGVQNTWVDLAMLYSLPFVASSDGSSSSSASTSGSSGSSGSRLKPVPPINIAQEQGQLNKIFQECQRAIHTMRAVATVDSLRKVLDRGVTVLHFSGHGGRIAGKTNCLVFEDAQRTGLAHFIDANTLRNILNGGVATTTSNGANEMDAFSPPLLHHTHSLPSFQRNDSQDLDDDKTLPLPPPPLHPSALVHSASYSSTTSSSYSSSLTTRSLSSFGGGSSAHPRFGLSATLKLVFVSSCHSRDVGEVFIQAGVQHVVCVRSGDKVLDESSSMFAYAFYHAVLAGKTIHQAFEIARVRVSADAQTLEPNEGDKFVLLESSQVHAESCPLAQSDGNGSELPVALEVDFSAATNPCTCHAANMHFVFTDISTGKWMDVSPTNRFSKTLPAIPESFVGREQELHMLAGLVNTQRVVTMRGPPGIGKSTLSVKLAHFLAERHVFPDGVAFIRLRGVQSLEGMETAIKSALFPDGGRDKEMLLHQALGEMHVLLIMDNMEDPINANPAAVREFLLHLLQNTPHLAFLMTARQAMGGGISGFDEKVVSLNRLSHFHAADLFLRKSPRALLLSEIGDIDPHLSSQSRSASVLEALTSHPLMAFLDGHPQAISLCAPLLQDRSLSELTRAVLSRGVSELQVVGLGAHDRSAMNTLVTSLDVSLEQVRQHHGQDAIRFFALLGLLPAGAMPADFKSLWGPKWESFVETLLRFSLIQRNRIPGFILSNNRGLPKQGATTGTAAVATRRSSSSRTSGSSRASSSYDQALLTALKAYGDFISGTASSRGGTESSGDTESFSSGSSRLATSTHMAGASERNLLNTLTRSGRVSRVTEHVAKMDSQAEILAVCVSYSTFPFITSYARSLLGLYDGEGTLAKNQNHILESICVADRELFLYNCARHFWKVSFWIFQHICTLAARSSASYLILDMHESNLWMILDLHIRMMEDWRAVDDADKTTTSSSSAGLESALAIDCLPPQPADHVAQQSLRERTSSYVVDVACFFAHALFLAGRHRGAWNAVNKALHIAKYHKDTLSEANTRKLMGILLTTETKFDEAKAQFGLALILYKAVGDKLGQAASLSAIGMIHSRKGNLRGAHNCFTKALTLYEWFKHSLGQLNCHQRLANLEKKLRDGDGLRGKPGQGGGVSGGGGGHSHHYAATRRLQGDLNRKRNGEYIVRWVGHEMSLLLELPAAKAEKVQEAHAPATVSTSLSSAEPNHPSAVSGENEATLPSPRRGSGSVKPRTPGGVANSPKKCRLGHIIDQRERAAAATSQLESQHTPHSSAAASSAAASVVVPAAGAAPVSSPASSLSDSLADKLKASSFARRKEYDAAIRRTLSSSATASGSGSGADSLPPTSSADAAPSA